MQPSDGRAPAPDWCTLAGAPADGRDEAPNEAASWLSSGVSLPLANLSCPTDFSDWVPFLSRSTGGIDLSTLTYDDDGVLQYQPEEGDPRYLTLAIANLALMLYGDIVAGQNPDALEMLRTQADWLVDNAVSESYGGAPFQTWQEDVPRPAFGQEAPVSSAYAQGVALPGLVGAFCATGDLRYRRAAERALAAFAVPMSRGGVTTWVSDNEAWFEEAAHTDGPSSRILNGHMRALAGLWAVANWTGSTVARGLLDAGVRAMRQEMHLYNAGFLSVYSQWASPGLFPLVADASNYNALHTVELSWLFEITGDPAFLQEALQVSRYDDPGFEIDVSGTVSGNPELPFNREALDEWVEFEGGWVEWTFPREQTVSGLTLWSKDPELRPETYRVDIMRPGEDPVVYARSWPTGCNDTYLPLPDLPAEQVRVTLRSDEHATVGVRALGLHRSAGHPSAVAQFMYHSMFNMPSRMFDKEGWSYPRTSWVQLDLQDTYEDLEIEFGGWTGVEPPILTGGDSLDVMTALEFSSTHTGSTMFVSVDDVDVRFLRVEFPTTSYGADRRMWVRAQE